MAALRLDALRGVRDPGVGASMSWAWSSRCVAARRRGRALAWSRPGPAAVQRPDRRRAFRAIQQALPDTDIYLTQDHAVEWSPRRASTALRHCLGGLGLPSDKTERVPPLRDPQPRKIESASRPVPTRHHDEWQFAVVPSGCALRRRSRAAAPEPCWQNGDAGVAAQGRRSARRARAVPAADIISSGRVRTLDRGRTGRGGADPQARRRAMRQRAGAGRTGFDVMRQQPALPDPTCICATSIRAAARTTDVGRSEAAADEGIAVAITVICSTLAVTAARPSAAPVSGVPANHHQLGLQRAVGLADAGRHRRSHRRGGVADVDLADGDVPGAAGVERRSLRQPVIACLVAAWRLTERGTCAEIEPLWMMRPPCGTCVFIVRKASRVHGTCRSGWCRPSAASRPA